MKSASCSATVAAAQAVLLFRQHHDGAAFRRLVGQAGKLRGVGQFVVGDAVDGEELDGLAIAERDGAGLVEQQRVDVAGGLDRLAAHGQHVVLHHAIHAGDADGGEQSADGRRDQADQQRDQHGHAGHGAEPACATLYAANGCSVTTASRKISVRPAIRMLSAISFGVFCRCAPSTSAIMRSRNVSPGFEVIRTLI